MDIVERNRLRAEAGLPILEVETEGKRLAAVRSQAEFEAEWAARRTEFSQNWTGNGAGWTANMVRYAMARRKVRGDMK